MTETEESKLSESIAQGDRRPSHGRGNLRVLQGPDRPLQGATLCKIRRFLPMTVTGKIQKFVMREEAISELGLQDQAVRRC